MIKIYVLFVVLLVPFTFTYNSTLVDLYRECLNNDNCLSINDNVDIKFNKDTSNLNQTLLAGAIILFILGIVFARHLTR
ncbi:MAG: hypothetical protein KatS3mg003_0150 [Candidatus Nitrosocaldaceae archaeon]|nr:MAG: hypothetical protein KatS3mg003_0150 [Candidatus Nitrosocaldaceae archaeon]